MVFGWVWFFFFLRVNVLPVKKVGDGGEVKGVSFFFKAAVGKQRSK